MCFYCNKIGHTQRHCNKKKAYKAKGKGKPGGGRRGGGHSGGPHAGAALAFTDHTGNAESSKAHGSTRELLTWVLDSGATNHMTTGDMGFTIHTAGRRAEVTLTNGDKVPIKKFGYAFMDVCKGNSKTRMLLVEAMLLPLLTSNLLSVRAVDRNRGAVVFVDNAFYILETGMLFARAECSTRRRWSAM